jgi:CRP/FNR family cyclic AMP-dependent transcriptional regulator
MAILPQSVQHLPKVRLEEGDTLIEEGKTQAELYFLISGSVEVVKDGIQIVRVSDPGAVFGEMSILLKQPHSAAVRALEASEFRVADDPVRILQSSPELALYVAEILARRLDALNRYLVDVKSQFKERADHLGMLDEVLTR